MLDNRIFNDSSAPSVRRPMAGNGMGRRVPRNVLMGMKKPNKLVYICNTCLSRSMSNLLVSIAAYLP